MNYKTAYKKLNQNGVIDEIINREVANGANLNMVKYNIIEGINHYNEFTKSSTFIKTVGTLQQKLFRFMWNTEN